VIAAERLPAFPEVAEMLELPPRTEVLRVQRLRLANLEPMAVETLFVEAARFPGLEERLTDNSSFYALLRTEYSIALEEAEETIESGIASPSDSQLLGTETGWPMLLLTRRTWDVEGRPVEFVRSLYRGDRYRFITRLKLVPAS
jgi:GntR family transcriptional regulator